MARNVIADAVLVQTTTTGTGTYALGNAVASHLTLAQAGIQSGDRVCFTVVDSLTAPTQREIVEGIYTAGSPATLTRAAVLMTHTGGTSAVNWGAGTKYIFVTPSARRLPVLDTDGLLQLSTIPARPGHRLARLGGGLTIPNGAQTIVSFDTTTYNDLPGSSSFDGARIIVTTPGKFVVRGQVYWAVNGNGSRRVELLSTDTSGNGVVLHGAREVPTSSDGAADVSGEAFIGTTRHFLMRVTQSSGGALDVVSGTSLSVMLM